jgi:hypothetical protein
MRLEIHTFDRGLLSYLFEKEEVSQGEELKLPGFSLKYDRTFSPRVVHFPQIIHFEVLMTERNGPSELAEWMYYRLKKKQVERLLIDSSDVAFELNYMRKVLKEKSGF